MDSSKKKTERILKGTVIGLLCLFLLLCGFLFLKMGQDTDSMEQNAHTEDTYAPPPETSEEAASSEDTAPNTEDTDPDTTEPQETSATEAPADNSQGQTGTGNTSVNKPSAPEDEQDEPDTTRPSAPEQDKEDKPASTEPQETEPQPTEPEATEPEATEPEKNVIQVLGQVTAENNVVTQQASFGENGVSAQIPAGTLLNDNTTELVLTIEEKDSTDSGITPEAGHSLQPLDVHIEGVSPENTAPITVCLGKLLPNGMNIGNVTLYHVENGTANPMTQVLAMSELTAHNQFYYDPATGDTTVMMASFSEIAVVSEEAKWEGNIAEAFNGGNGSENNPWIIANADQLAYMSKIVSNNEAYADDYYKLISNVDLSGDIAQENDNKKLVFYPIGYWKQQDGTNSAGEVWYGAGNTFTGTFDGNGNTISNIYQNTWLMDGNYDYGYWKTAMGLFGALWSAEIKNLTVDNFQSDGEFTPTGCIAAYAGGPNMLFENISLTNCNPRVYNTGNGGLVGLNYNSTSGEADHITFRNVTVDQTNKISALWGSYDVSCGGILGRLRENSKHDGTNTDGQKNTVTFENCHVAAIMDVNNDVCANYQYYQYRYSGMFIGTVDYVGDVPAVGVADVISATDCTYTYGDWNEYWYCELVKNSLASYTHDHQFSRLTKISSLDEIKSGETWLKEGNFVLPNGDNTAAECYHIFKASEGNLYRHFHNVADESNPDIYETKDINGNGELDDLKEDRYCYFIPFGQLWTGYGWGSSPAYDAASYENIDISLREDGLVKSESKFAAKDVTTVAEGATVNLSELFTLAVDETKLSKSTLAVFVSPIITDTTTSTVTADVSINTSSWGDSTLTFSGTGAAKIVITDYFYCTPTVLNIEVTEREPVEKFVTKFTGNFLYRVGNANTVALGSLFEESATVTDASVSVTYEVTNGNVTMATPAYNTTAWESGTLDFDGTGVVTLTITDGVYCIPTTLTVEIVDAYNITANSNGVLTGWNDTKSVVLLEDVAIAANDALRKTGGTVYGNGFTLDATNAAYSAVAYDSESYVIYLENSNLDNIKITGKVYPEVGATRAENYNRALILSTGDCTIANSFLSNTASPIRNGGNLELINTTLKGGVYANMDIRNGQVILDNVTTINQISDNEADDSGNTLVGLGIVVYQEGGTESLSIVIKNKLTQYNYLSNSQAENITDTMSKTVATTMFKSEYSDYQYDDGTTLWVNTGIIGMNNYFTEDDIDDQRAEGHGYVKKGGNVTSYGQTRYCTVYSAKPTAITSPSEYVTTGQYIIAPTATPDFTTKNYLAKAEGSNDYCYADNGTVYISIDQGDTFNWNTDILSVTKSGSLDIESVAMNGVDYTGKSIPFAESGDYEVVYKYSDPYNYILKEDGTVSNYTISYEKIIPINVVAVAPDAKNAVFSFGANGTACAAKTVQIGDKTYVMPDVTATVDGKIGSTTVNGTTVYYPITEMYTSDSKTAHTGSWYACFPIFKDALQIIDYADNGTGDPVTYNQTNVTTVAGIPSSLKATDPTSAFLYSMNATNYPPPSDPTAVSGAVCYTCNQNGLTASNTRNEMTIIAEYTYMDNAGTTYYYYIGYHCAAQTNGLTECVTADTMITLADGSQVRVDALTGDEELLVWNLETGSYDTAPIVFIDSDAETEYEVVNLHFSDGSEVGVIYEHGFFDYELGEYVYLDASNAESYIGHTFVTQGDIAGNTWNTATLTDVVIEKKVTTAYSPVSFSHLCYYTDGVLSMPGGIEGLFNIFEVDTSIMAYDAEKKAQDIETYGLYTYEDFAGLIPEEAFYAFNGAYLKVAIEKGLLTWEDIEYLAERYVPLM